MINVQKLFTSNKECLIIRHVNFILLCSELLSLLTRTAQEGESNSILIIGQRGSGKTTVRRDGLDSLDIIKIV